MRIMSGMYVLILCMPACAAEKYLGVGEKSLIPKFEHQGTIFPYVIIKHEHPSLDHHVYKHYHWKKSDTGEWKGFLKPESVLNFTM